MNGEPASEHSTTQSPAVSLPFPTAVWARVLYCIFVLVMPAISFWATEFFKPEWQNGDISSYIILLLSPTASFVFLLLLAFSIVCYILFLTDYERYSQYFIVRLGIYMGVLLAFQFSILAGFYFIKNGPLAVLLVVIWILPLLISKAYPRAQAKWGAKRLSVILAILFLLVAIFIAVKSSLITAPFFLLLMGLTVAAPFWSFLMALRAAIWLFKNVETKMNLAHGLGLTAWFGIYLVAWRYGILKMYELYAALPPQPPSDCYIATAAAQGHPRFVSSNLVLRADGKSVRVNKQLQILKCAELALLALYPRVHKTLRGIYDVVGKSLAKRMQNPFLADIAYFFLKPGEWLAGLILKLLIPEIDQISSKMYMK